jgi:hypothetical protein
VTDYIPITHQTPDSALLGTWWRQPPHELGQTTYAPYRGEGVQLAKVQGEVITPTGKKAERYDPIEEPDLLNALLDVAQGKLKPVQFADRFGLLGYNYLVPLENRCKDGDPLHWFVAQARTIYTLAELIRYVREAERGDRYLPDYLREDISNGPFALGGKVVATRFRTATRSPTIAANGIIRYLINANLGTTGRVLQSSDRGLRTIFTFQALVQVIYWQLADRIGKSSIHRCIECGRIFSHSNVRARFCPPQGGKKISACKSRWNVREFRGKQKRSRRKK